MLLLALTCRACTSRKKKNCSFSKRGVRERVRAREKCLSFVAANMMCSCGGTKSLEAIDGSSLVLSTLF
jgi:hypothetical protein